MALPEYPKVRAPGLLETFSITRRALQIHNNIVSAAAYVNPKFSQPLENIVRQAVALLVGSVSALSVVPVNDLGPDRYYGRLPVVDLEEAVRFIEWQGQLASVDTVDVEIEQMLDRLIHISWPKDASWRLFVLRNSRDTSRFVAMFVNSHVIGDGKTCIAFHRHFNRALAKLCARDSLAETSVKLAEPCSEPLTPNLEQHHSLPLSVRYFLSVVWEQWFPKSDPETWLGNKITFTEKGMKAIVTYRVLPAAKTALLIQQSRIEKTTVTAVVQAMLAKAVYDNIPETYKTLLSIGTLHLRRFLPSTDQDKFGNFYDCYMHKHARSSSSDIWETARQVRQSITEVIDRKGKDLSVGLLRWIKSMPKFYKSKENQPRKASIEIAGMGVFQHTVEETWNVEWVMMAQSQEITAAPLSLSFVTGPDGCLRFVFAALQEDINAEMLDKIINSFMTEVDKTIQKPEPPATLSSTT